MKGERYTMNVPVVYNTSPAVKTEKVGIVIGENVGEGQNLGESGRLDGNNAIDKGQCIVDRKGFKGKY